MSKSKNNINSAKLIDLLKTRIGNIDLKDEDLVKFIDLSLSAYNSYPPETLDQLEDDDLVEQRGAIIIQYASYLLFSKLALEEKRKEFVQKDNGVEFVAPNISDLLYQTARDEYERWVGMVDTVKRLSDILEQVNNLMESAEEDEDPETSDSN